MTNVKRTQLRTAALLAVGCLTYSAAQSPTPPAGAEWRTYASDLASTKYSPLDQIDARNVNRLQVAWRWKSFNFEPRIEGNMETTPLIIGAVLMLPSVNGGANWEGAALDPETGIPYVGSVTGTNAA